MTESALGIRGLAKAWPTIAAETAPGALVTLAFTAALGALAGRAVYCTG